MFGGHTFLWTTTQQQITQRQLRQREETIRAAQEIHTSVSPWVECENGARGNDVFMKVVVFVHK